MEDLKKMGSDTAKRRVKTEEEETEEEGTAEPR